MILFHGPINGKPFFFLIHNEISLYDSYTGHTSNEYPMIRTPIKRNIVYYTHKYLYPFNELIFIYKKTCLLSVTQL